MYRWLWRSLPGGMAARTAQCVLLLAAAIITLWLWVFPWAYLNVPL